MRRRLHRKDKKQKKIIITLSFLLVLFLSVGYAAFNNNLTLKAKGNVYNKGDLCYETSDNGDGTVTITDYDATCGTEVNIPSKIKGKTVTKIADSPSWEAGKTKSFSRKGLTKVTISDTVTYIGKWAFYNNSIAEVDLGESVTEIADEAFFANQLTTLSFPKSLKKIGSGSFMSNYLTSIPSLDNIEYKGGAFTRNSLTSENAFIYAKNSNGSIDYTTLNSYATRTYIEKINIPSGIKTLEQQSMRSANTSIINLPDGIETIIKYAFHQSAAKTYNIPSSITTIEKNAFCENKNITINIDRKENAISGSPWGAYSATVNWTGTN